MMELELSQSSGDLAEDPQWFEAAVAEYRKSSSHIGGLALRPPGTGLKSRFRRLRLYVLFMVVVVILNIVLTLH
jgi:hypothetical protein